MNKSEELPQRIVYFDYLRVFATFATVVLHVAAQNWSTVSLDEWHVFNIYDSIVRWGVPVFIMISGALFLEEEQTIEKIYKKNILRLLTAFLFWGLIYALVVHGNRGIIKVLSNAAVGYYHMWFILMMIGLYMCIPIIRKIIETEWIMKYFLALAFLFSFLFPQVVNLINDFGSETLVKVVDILNSDIANMNLNLVLGYTAYFIGGYYLNKIEIQKRERRLIYIFGAVGFGGTILLTVMSTIVNQALCGKYYGNFTINVMLEALAVFVWFKYNANKNRKVNVIIKRLSEYSFGVYLVHVLVIEQLDLRIGLNTLSFNPYISVPVMAIIVTVISYVVSAVLNHIPILKKYIV